VNFLMLAQAAAKSASPSARSLSTISVFLRKASRIAGAHCLITTPEARSFSSASASAWVCGERLNIQAMLARQAVSIWARWAGRRQGLPLVLAHQEVDHGRGLLPARQIVGQAELERRTIEEIARERGVDPVDTLLDIGLADDLETTFIVRLLNVDEKRVGDLIADDGNLISLSDAGAHLTLFCDAGYAMHLLGRWVRELGRFSLPHAIRKLTGDPAHIYGIVDRGRIEVSAWADLMLFDSETIHVSKTRRVADLPTGANRLIRNAPASKA